MSTAPEVTVERPLPATLPAGAATAVLCLGAWPVATAAVDVIVDGRRHPATVVRVPGRPEARRFWAVVVLRAGAAPARIAVQVAGTAAVGAEIRAPYGEVAVVEAAGPDPPRARADEPGRGLIAVCMATFEPDEALFAAQVASLRAQTDRGWICLVSDDASGPEGAAVIERVVGDDPRFAIVRHDERAGFYRNFERALARVPPHAALVALCDQDDVWHPDKLATLRAAIGTARLAYSDQRLVDADGAVLRDTLWSGRRNNVTNLTSMVVANTVTGAATLFRRELLAALLPFPDGPGLQFHDHWLGLVALACGDIAYVDRPLYDYVQHRGAVFGDVSRGGHRPRARPRGALTRWRAAYFYGYLSRAVQVRTVLARVTPPPDRRRALERFAAAERSPVALGRLVARTGRELAGRNETLGSEWGLARGVAWRWLARLGARVETGMPPLDAFEQVRLRRWRAGVRP